MKKTYKILILVGFLAFLTLFAFWYLKPEGNKTEETQESVILDVPDAESEEVQSSKSEAYKKASGRKQNYDDYFDSLLSDKDDGDGDISLVSGQESATKAVSAPSEERINDVLGIAAPEPEKPVKKAATSKPRSSVASSVSSAPVNTPVSSDEKFIQDMDRARAIAAALGMSEEGSAKPQGESGQTQDTRIDVPSSTVSKSGGIISSLDDWEDDSADLSGEDFPVKCMFMKDEKLKNGQRVTIRTLQDFYADGHLIPANSHLTATCSISGRLTMNVASAEIGGRIITLNYEAYDFDGSRGIYCPETTASKNARSATSQAVSQGSSLIGGYVGTIASAVVRTGASLMQNANGESCVNITNGYEFYLMKKRQ